MLRRAHTPIVLLPLLGALTLPCAALAVGSGGAGVGTSPSVGATVQPAYTTATVSGNGITLSARGSVMLRHHVAVTGSIQGARAGSTIALERPAGRSSWVVATTATVAADGSFTATWRADRVGRVALRAVTLPHGVTATAASTRAGGTAGASTSTAPAPTPGAPELDVTVYRPAIATVFGEGFFGKQTACGQVLQADTLGVANRHLRCGTKVSIEYGGRTIVVPVIDRGPYANGASWDLTQATAEALGMSETETVGATF